nr:hypothetical protein [Tanacetum cinerariifolium]
MLPRGGGWRLMIGIRAAEIQYEVRVQYEVQRVQKKAVQGSEIQSILEGADNRPPMLENDMYNSWKSRMELYMLNHPHGRMILESVEQELWERIQMLMQGTSSTKQERECKLYDAFDKFSYQKGETLRDFYLKFSLLLNDMNMYNMKLE